ncbi:ATP-binding cassette domain-containing protein [Microbacterium sp.]|uniref:ATP-binding cassette domain-containing protein n=1 Tax=Microbacterium sp. TaxID=51671 RepID=UPI003A877514
MIEVKALAASYGTREVLSDVSFCAHAGQVTSVVGPNGAGKSTLFRAILGLQRASHGVALLNGLPYGASDASLATIGAAIDPTWLSGRRCVRDELRLAAAPQRIPKTRIGKVLREADLEEVAGRRVKTLSLGMRQRLSIARALLGEPSILVLDEPTNGLDLDGVMWVRQLVRSAAEAGGTVLLSSHVLAELEMVSDRVVVLRSGRVILDRSTSELHADSNVAVRIVSDDPGALADLLAHHGIACTSTGRVTWVVGHRARELSDFAFQARLFIESVTETRRTLEDEYVRAVARAESAGPGWAR